jgi:hypothetical protein
MQNISKMQDLTTPIALFPNCGSVCWVNTGVAVGFYWCWAADGEFTVATLCNLYRILEAGLLFWYHIEVLQGQEQFYCQVNGILWYDLETIIGK